MATLIVNLTTDYSNVVFPEIIKEIVFDTGPFNTFATFDAGQFDDVQISQAVEVTGTVTDEGVWSQIIVQNIAGSFSAASWTFAAPARIALFGSGGADEITGNTQAAAVYFFGGGGADTLIGTDAPPGVNIFGYLDPTDLVAGEIVIGSNSSVDLLGIYNPGNYNFSVANISGVEYISFENFVSARAIFSADQIGSGKLIGIIDNMKGIANTFTVFGSTVDLSEMQFVGLWDPHADKVEINGTAGNDNLIGSKQPDVISGSGGNDKLFGLGGNDTLSGGAGNDVLDGGAGADSMTGGLGDDTYFVDDAGDTVIEKAGSGIDHVVASVKFTPVPNVEKLTLIGTSAIDATGDSLANVIVGNDGANRINGGLGLDILTGGLGPDTFVFDFPVKPKKQAKLHKDEVLDFSHKDDTIELAAAVFTQLKAGKLKKKDFDSGKKKPAKDKHLVYYDEKHDSLWYDANGKKKGGKGDIEIATFNKDADLAANDFLIA